MKKCKMSSLESLAPVIYMYFDLTIGDKYPYLGFFKNLKRQCVLYLREHLLHLSCLDFALDWGHTEAP